MSEHENTYQISCVQPGDDEFSIGDFQYRTNCVTKFRMFGSEHTTKVHSTFEFSVSGLADLYPSPAACMKPFIAKYGTGSLFQVSAPQFFGGRRSTAKRAKRQKAPKKPSKPLSQRKLHKPQAKRLAVHVQPSTFDAEQALCDADCQVFDDAQDGIPLDESQQSSSACDEEQAQVSADVKLLKQLIAEVEQNCRRRVVDLAALREQNCRVDLDASQLTAQRQKRLPYVEAYARLMHRAFGIPVETAISQVLYPLSDRLDPTECTIGQW
eukprot:TRINITY_DN2503_c0_g1_i2.p2 TRINITY_DN2503_c0_g1~~TRINITY_DN2503_c0_g1_i2.p2  ORF type:complete len:268 (-),score=40.22 TRINITY_DN2503_c0_g1_i2:1283-2086(-)